jgi:hypothetical protein
MLVLESCGLMINGGEEVNIQFYMRLRLNIPCDDCEDT